MKFNEKMVLELKLAHDAEVAGVRRLALFHWLHAFLIASDADREVLCRENPVTFVPWAYERTPVAFLGCFTRSDGDYVLPLKRGVNRLGRSPVTADHTVPPSVRLMEERQWLLITGVEGRTFVTGDRSSSISVLLRGDSEELIGSPDLPSMRLARSGIEIDRGGDVLYSLNDGDVLVNFYDAFVFVVSDAIATAAPGSAPSPASPDRAATIGTTRR